MFSFEIDTRYFGLKEEKRTNAKTGWTLDTRAIYQSTGKLKLGKLKLTSGAEILTEMTVLTNKWK